LQRAGAGVDVRDLERRRREEFVAAVPLRAASSASAGASLVHRVARQLRVGDMALHAAHRSRPESVPRRPFLIVSPSRSTEVGSPTMQ
jgi:hypothetical protein